MLALSSSNKQRYALPAHLRSVVPDSLTDDAFDYASNGALQADGTQVKEDSKGSWNQRLMVLSAPNSGVSNGTPWFQVDVMVVDHPYEEGAFEIVDSSRVALDESGTTITTEPVYSAKVSSDGGKDKWTSFDIPDKVQTLRRGSVFRVSVYGKTGTVRQSGVDRAMKFGDIVWARGLTCKCKKNKKDSGGGADKSKMFFVNFSASSFEFRTTLEDAESSETRLWLTVTSYMSQEVESWQPMIQNTNVDAAELMRKREEKKRKAEEEKRSKDGSSNSAASSSNADEESTALAIKSDLEAAGLAGARFRPSRADTRDLGDDLLMDESRAWKSRNFERYVPLNDIAPQVLQYRERVKWPYVHYKTIGGFDSNATNCFQFQRKPSDDDKKKGIVPAPEPHWFFGRECFQVQPTLSNDEDEYRDSRVRIHVHCWKDSLRSIGIANPDHQMALWGYMAEGAVGFVKTFIQGDKSAKATEHLNTNPFKHMAFELNGASKKNVFSPSIFLDLASTILSTSWEISSKTAGDLLDVFSKHPDFADRLARNMATIKNRTFVKMNPLNEANVRRVVNVFECDSDIVAQSDTYRFYVLCNVSKKQVFAQVSNRLGGELPENRLKVLHTIFVNYARLAVAKARLDRAPRPSDKAPAAAKNAYQQLLKEHNDIEAEVMANEDMALFASSFPFNFTIFAINKEYLTLRKLADYDGVDVYGDVFVPQEDYLLDWINKDQSDSQKQQQEEQQEEQQADEIAADEAAKKAASTKKKKQPQQEQEDVHSWQEMPEDNAEPVAPAPAKSTKSKRAAATADEEAAAAAAAEKPAPKKSKTSAKAK